jgi:hypothetical protein
MRGAVAGGYYHADTEDGGHWDDPSEDLLFMLIGELSHPGNTFVVIEPDDESMDWFASVSLLEDGTHEMEWRDMSRHDHELTVETDRGHIAKQLTIWLAARHYPGKPARNSARTSPEF